MKHFIPAIVMVALFLSCAKEEVKNVVTEPVASNEAFVAGETHVYFSEDMADLLEEAIGGGSVQTKSSELNETLESLGIEQIARVFPDAGEFEPRTRKAGLHRWYYVKYSEDIPQTKAMDAFLALGGVEKVEPVRKIQLNVMNDPGYTYMWGFKNTVTEGVDINVEPVWERYTTGNPDVLVAVVDSGIDLTHEDLAGNIHPDDNKHCNAASVTNLEEGQLELQLKVGKKYIVADDHGTHVAGTVAAVNNNKKGVAGVAGGDSANGQKGVSLMSCQIFENGSSTTLSSAAAIKWSADNGAVISQNSWGYIYDNESQAINDVVTEVDKDAIDYFIKYAGCDNEGNQLPDSPMKGGIVIFAAGNDAFRNSAPGNYSEVIAVGAVDKYGERTSYSNYGDWVDIAAPGGETGANEDMIFSTVLRGGEDSWEEMPGYGFMNGTSMACPHVSGVAALLVSYFGGQGFTNEMLKERILNTANKTIPSPTQKIGRLVDALAAFEYGRSVEVNPATGLALTGEGNTIKMSWTVPSDSEGQPAYGYLIVYDTDKADVEAASTDNLKNVSTAVTTPGGKVGSTVKYTLTGLDFDKTYYVKVLAYSFNQDYAPATDIAEAKTGVNNKPVISTSYTGSMEVSPFKTLEIPITVTEPDGHAVKVTYTNGSAADTFKQTSAGWTLTIVGKNASAGTYTASMKAEDEYGLSTVKQFKYTILSNSAPEKIKEIDNMLLTQKGAEFTIDMTQYVQDADPEVLKYSLTNSDPKVVHMISKGDRLIGTPLSYGVSTVAVKVRDTKGESVEFGFKVLVKDPSSEVSVYPLQVTDYVNVGTLETPADTHIKVISQTGKTIYDQTTSVSGYEPAKINMKSCAPGIYTVVVSFAGNEYKENIVKL